jgi:hypothetical protein
MTGIDARSECWPDGAEEQAWLARPRATGDQPQTPPYWTLDTTTEEWVQHQRDGTEIRRAPTRHRHQEA